MPQSIILCAKEGGRCASLWSNAACHARCGLCCCQILSIHAPVACPFALSLVYKGPTLLDCMARHVPGSQFHIPAACICSQSQCTYRDTRGRNSPMARFTRRASTIAQQRVRASIPVHQLLCHCITPDIAAALFPISQLMRHTRVAVMGHWQAHVPNPNTSLPGPDFRKMDKAATSGCAPACTRNHLAPPVHLWVLTPCPPCAQGSADAQGIQRLQERQPGDASAGALCA